MRCGKARADLTDQLQAPLALYRQKQSTPGTYYTYKPDAPTALDMSGKGSFAE